MSHPTVEPPAAKRELPRWNEPGARPLVRFEGVSKRFGGVRGVENLTLDIYESEFFALLGPSGCGKTTLLRLLARFEPLAALDRKLRGETQFELMQLRQRLRLTFVIVTHDQEEAMTVADRIGVMDRGELIQVATAPEIYEQPNSRWVADFIGEVNLIEGTVA